MAEKSNDNISKILQNALAPIQAQANEKTKTEEEEQKKSQEQNPQQEKLQDLKHLTLNESEYDILQNDISSVKSGKQWSSLFPNEKLIQNLKINGFAYPSKIQANTIAEMIKMSSKNWALTAQSHNGSGKTLCFLIGSFFKVDIELPFMDPTDNFLLPQVLIFAPTQELVNQILNVGKLIFEETGVMIAAAHQKLRSHIVVGTVRGIYNMIFPSVRGQRKIMDLNQIKCIAVDEADFIQNNEQDYVCLQKIIGAYHQNRQQVLFYKQFHLYIFSATLNKQSLSSFHLDQMQNQKEILVEEAQKLTLKGVNQFMSKVPNHELLKFLSKLYQTSPQGQSIIFCGTKVRVDEVSVYLTGEGYHVGKLTSDLQPYERTNVMEAFRTKKITHLITTNLLARGFDQRSVTLVINIGIPFHHENKQTDCETYLHRIGRTGRMGDVGIALSIIEPSDRDINRINDLQKHFQSEIKNLSNLDDLPKLIDECINLTQGQREKLTQEEKENMI